MLYRLYAQLANLTGQRTAWAYVIVTGFCVALLVGTVVAMWVPFVAYAYTLAAFVLMSLINAWWMVWGWAAYRDRYHQEQTEKEIRRRYQTGDVPRQWRTGKRV